MSNLKGWCKMEGNKIKLECKQADETGTGQNPDFLPRDCDTHDQLTQPVCKAMETRLTIKQLPKLVYLAFDRVPSSLRVPPDIADDRVVSSQHNASQERG